MSVEDATSLTPGQASALFDILTHRETYAEIETFNKPDAVQSYGPPFQSSDVHSASPLLQTMLSRFFLPLPGVKDFGSPFWTDLAGPLLSELAASNLSESFDKGDCGQRKTLATAASALLEYLARGKFGGLPRRDIQRQEDDYDLENPDDLVTGFEDWLQRLVYGDILGSTVKKIAETSDLSEHTMQLQATHRFILINFASFMHYTLVVSSKGPALLSLLENAHRLVPYTIMRQTLKVGNAATMINGMIRIVLTKASVGAVTNWLGLSSGSDEGMNLMQTIISTVLGWDSRSFKKRIVQIEKAEDAPSKDHLEKLRSYTLRPRKEQETLRQESKRNGKSLVSTILQLEEPMPEATQNAASEYLASQLSIEDRDRIVNSLCKRNPDLTTPLVRSVVSAYEPVIRRVHQAVDLSAGLSDLETFITDTITLAKPRPTADNSGSNGNRVPVSSFVKLCEKHQTSCHRFMHQLAKNGPEVTEWYENWVRSTTKQFQYPVDDTSPLKSLLDPLVTDISGSDRKAVMEEVDRHAEYLAQLSSSSESRARALVAATDPLTKSKQSPSKSQNQAGPGVFLAKWQALIDDTEVGPAHHDGASKARDQRVSQNRVEKEVLQAPKVDRTLQLLLAPFRNAIRAASEKEDWSTE